MSVRDGGFDAQGGRGGAAPTDGRLQLRGGMDREPVWFHIAGNPDMLIGGIRYEIRCFVFTPAFDEIVTGRALDRFGEITIELDGIA